MQYLEIVNYFKSQIIEGCVEEMKDFEENLKEKINQKH